MSRAPLKNLRKVNDIDWQKYSRASFPERENNVLVHSDKESVMEVEPPYCSFFGCGKKLSLQEMLFGNRCLRHQKQREGIF
jgi:hypothetical protein